MVHRISLRGDLAEIARLNDWLAARFAEGGLPDAIAGDLRLCVNEAVANTIAYGFEGRDDAAIELRLEMSATGARAVITDNGMPFDPLEAPVATRIEGIETARIGGFGIKLIRETASALDYRRAGGRNALTILCGAL